MSGSHSQAGGQLHRVTRISGIPCSGWRDRIRFGFASSGAPVRGLRKEVEAGIHCVPKPTSLYCGGGALQQRPIHAFPSGAHGCGRNARQRSHLRYLPPLP